MAKVEEERKVRCDRGRKGREGRERERKEGD